ncbi:metallophosphoesterase family protein [Bauldia sp.]|uniref:metallophosphoesterase family protein n=1 Tax=Bauldia sp. TaxID=2575872 RepID=UPI003BABB1E5
MRLLAVADLHYSLPKYDWLLATASKYDLVVIAGDHLDLTSGVDFRAQAVVVRKYLDRLKAQVPVLTCSGNHDLDSRNAEGEKIARWVRDLTADGVPADGTSFVLDDTFFTICPWWDGPIEREAIARQLATDSPKREGRRWIWIHHAPPIDSPTSWGGQRSFGDQELSDWIREYAPDIVLAGHVHQSPFVPDGSWVDWIGDTWIFNAGHQYGAPPSCIILDTDQNAAVWLSAAGAQEVSLDQPLVRPIPPLTSLPVWLTSSDPAPGPIPA